MNSYEYQLTVAVCYLMLWKWGPLQLYQKWLHHLFMFPQEIPHNDFQYRGYW